MAPAIPLANTVFPAPSGPESTTTSPARSCVPSVDPSATVSSTRSQVAVPDVSGMAAQPFPNPACRQSHLAGHGPVDQPDEPVVDGFGLVQQRQVAGPGDDDQLRQRQGCGHLPR